ncbi:MAG: DUF302 domain-containing protein [Acidimicrobiaceae bacterium]|nr:DUF302 domain-containing protein [Acidimicrobiaceae bacterium]
MDAIETTVTMTPEAAEAAIRAALADNGFGVLTEIDVQATFKAKLGLDRPFLKILGACNPGFANRALELDPSVALLLPCNVVVEAVEGGTKVSAVDPTALMNDPAFDALAAEVSAKLSAAVASLG